MTRALHDIAQNKWVTHSYMFIGNASRGCQPRRGLMKIAQSRRAGAGMQECIEPMSPVGMTEVKSSNVFVLEGLSRPYGTESRSWTREPSDESLGYCRFSHRDKQARNKKHHARLDTQTEALKFSLAGEAALSMKRNIEIKAACDDLDRVRAAVQALSAQSAGIEEQCDTYFRTTHGRLKLRRRLLNSEDAGAGAADEHFELIWYQRPDTTTAKGSDYYLIRVIDGAELRRLFADGLGILAEVHKRRTVYLWRNVRIHLDEVRRLGSFIELEAIVDGTCDEASALAKIDHLCKVLKILPDQLIDVSYSDLLLSAKSSSMSESNLARSS